jgi:alanine racemase
MAQELHRVARVHVFVDTGTGGSGVLPQEVAPLVREMVRLDGLEMEGLFTELAAADTLLEVAATQEQLRRFRAVYEGLRATGLPLPYVHAANSAAIFTLPDSLFTAVRPGLALLGLHPSLDVSCPAGFRRVLSWKTVVAQVRTLPAGWVIGRERSSRSISASRVAVIPVGHGDGLRMAPRGWGEVLIGEQRAPLISHPSVDHTLVDISHLAGVGPGDEVVLIGAQGTATITAEDVARRLDTTNAEVVTAISPRIPRRVVGGPP